MKHDQVLRIGSLPSRKKVIDAAKHNLRELPPADHIDQERLHLNRVLHGAPTVQEVSHWARSAWSGIEKVRANAIFGVEILICLPYTFNGDAMAFFTDALEWVDAFFQVRVLSAVVHFDETAPHMHVILLPIIEGRLQGSKVMGNLQRIQAMQADFYASVGVRYGLRRKTAHKRSKAEVHIAAMQILNAITSNLALLNGGQVKNLLLDAIGQNLDAFSASVGVTLPEPKAKPSKETFVSIMTKPQKPEGKKSPIGHLHVAVLRNPA